MVVVVIIEMTLEVFFNWSLIFIVVVSLVLNTNRIIKDKMVLGRLDKRLYLLKIVLGFGLKEVKLSLDLVKIIDLDIYRVLIVDIEDIIRIVDRWVAFRVILFLKPVVLVIGMVDKHVEVDFILINVNVDFLIITNVIMKEDYNTTNTKQRNLNIVFYVI